jgi:hypothetical protein
MTCTAKVNENTTAKEITARKGLPLIYLQLEKRRVFSIQPGILPELGKTILNTKSCHSIARSATTFTPEASSGFAPNVKNKSAVSLRKIRGVWL